MKRRDVLKAGAKAAAGATFPAAALAASAAAAPVAAIAAGEDPIMPIFREWVAARREWLSYAELPGNGNWDFPENKAAEARDNAAFDVLVGMTPASMEGIAAMACLLWTFNGPLVNRDHEEFAEEMTCPERRLTLAIYRAASGRDGFPDDHLQGATA